MSQNGLGRIYRKGGSLRWMMELWHQGRQYRKAAETHDEDEARSALGKWRDEVKRGTYVPEARQIMFADLERLALEDYAAEKRRSTRTLRNNIAHLREVFGVTRGVDISTPRIAWYIARRRKESAAPATIKKELNSLSLLLRCARTFYGGAFMHRVEFPRVTVPKQTRRKGFFEPDALRAVLQHLSPMHRVVVEFLSLTGWRLGEAVALEWRSVNRSSGIIRIEDTKSDEPRTLVYKSDPQLAELIRARREAVTEVERKTQRVVRYVFCNSEGEPFLTGFHPAWNRARKKAGLPGALIHDLRRTYARDAVRAGLSEPTIMRLCGWQTSGMFRRYAIVAEGDLALATRQKAEARMAAESQVRDRCGSSGKTGVHSGQPDDVTH
jgi:integrase